MTLRGGRTTTSTQTSTIYLDNSRHIIDFTIDIAAALAKRATLAKPKALRKFNLADTIQIIRCNNLYDVVQLPPPATITQTIVGARPKIGELNSNCDERYPILLMIHLCHFAHTVFTTLTRTKSSTSLTTVTTDTVYTEVKSKLNLCFHRATPLKFALSQNEQCNSRSLHQKDHCCRSYRHSDGR